jgi:hypothetical protein
VTDEVTRSAATLATLVAVPLALVAAVVVFVVMSGASGGGAPAGADGTADVPPAPDPAATSPVELPARELTERQEIVCRALLSQLPDQVRDLPQRPVTAGPEQNAAYGEPAITVECGVPPADFAPTDMVHPFERVCWHGAAQAGRSVWTTLDREVPVRVTVPDAYGGPFQWAAEFSPTIDATVRSADADTIPPGCLG